MTQEKLIEAARSWLGTPYHHRGRIKGVAVDCAQVVIASFAEAGLINDFDPGHYTSDWHLHRDEDHYLAFVSEHLVLLDDDIRSVDARLRDDDAYALPAGAVIVFRVGRTYSHGGIITQWPRMIHAYLPAEMVEEVDLRNTPMSERPAKVFVYEGFNQ